MNVDMSINSTSISGSIFGVIFGIFLILVWFPTIIFTEFNNKGNRLELDQLKKHMDTHMTLTDVNSITNNSNTVPTIISDFKSNTINNLITANKHVYITIDTATTVDNKETISKQDEYFINMPLFDGNKISNTDYKYLAQQNKLDNITIPDKTNNSIQYKITIYSLLLESKFVKITDLQAYEDEFDMKIYTYEYGPMNQVKQKLIKRKLDDNWIQKLIGRGGTFLMLLIGMSLLVSPLRALANLTDQFTHMPLLMAPLRFILSIYDSLSFFASLILTILMTLLVWSLVNYPLISILITGMIAGLTVYFKRSI